MKRIIGMTVAAMIVLLQLAGYAAWRLEPAHDLTPIDTPAAIVGHRA